MATGSKELVTKQMFENGNRFKGKLRQKKFKKNIIFENGNRFKALKNKKFRQ